MANWHGYIGIENLGLTSTQKQDLIDMLRALGPKTNPMPAKLCHFRIRMDTEAAIFEALFNDSNLSINKFKERLGQIYNVDPQTISHTTGEAQYNGGATAIITFTRGGTNRLKVAIFGGIGCTWQESRLEAVGYLAANHAQWESGE